MVSKQILYISTNGMWSGSEELWSRSAKAFAGLGYEVSVATRFAHPELEIFQGQHLQFQQRFSNKTLLKRGIERVLPIRFAIQDSLRQFIIAKQPQLVIISQGNNYESADVMKLCQELGFKYVTITQLVTNFFVFLIRDNNLPSLRNLYLKAVRNFFVSRNNLHLNNFLLGGELPNAEAIYNPCKLSQDDIAPYPAPTIPYPYQIGLVGRIECWHKGYDLFLEVVRQPKWQARPVQFNIYGDGPHRQFMATWIANWGLTNVILRGHSSHISDVWKENQLLLMPSRMEGQALALIEAMWCERAAVVTNVGGATELIDEGSSGFIAEAVTVSAIDAALERAWVQREYWQEMGQRAARALAERHPPDAVAFFNQRLAEVLP